jgi:hypothetical protein
MMSGPVMVLAMVMLMLPGMAWADFQVEVIGQPNDITSLQRYPQVALLSRESTAIMSPAHHDVTRPSFSVSYTDSDTDPMRDYGYAVSSSLFLHTQEKRFSTTAVGLAISDRIGLFGKAGLRYPGYGALSAVNLSDSKGYVLPLARRYGVGVNVMASEVLSLQFQWERHAPGGIGAGIDPSKSDWDPWKEKNVFGAGMRVGF